MIDVHTHLLPNLDDGSTSLESSVKALRQMSEGGIRSVILTSHYMRGLYQFKSEDYACRFREMEEEIKHQGIDIRLFPGAEVYLVRGIEDDICEKHLTLADSKYVLIETDLNGFPIDMQRNIYELLRKGYYPILAHAERYISVMVKSHEAKEIINRSVYIQISAGSLIGGYGDKVKETAWKLLNHGWVHLMGSDHHTRTDYGAFFAARKKIVEHIDEETALLLTKVHPQAILDNEKIDFEYVYIQKPKPKSRSHTFFGTL